MGRFILTIVGLGYFYAIYTIAY